MQLDQFVKEVLSSLIAGIEATEEVALQHNAIVNPMDKKVLYVPKPGTVVEGRKSEYRVARPIEFDIALTVELTGTASTGGKLAVMGVGIGGESASTTKNSTVSRVKFTLPVILPTVGQ